MEEQPKNMDTSSCFTNKHGKWHNRKIRVTKLLKIRDRLFKAGEIHTTSYADDSFAYIRLNQKSEIQYPIPNSHFQLVKNAGRK